MQLILHIIFTENNKPTVRGREYSCGFPFALGEYGESEVGSEIMTDCREACPVSFHAGSWVQQQHV